MPAEHEVGTGPPDEISPDVRVVTVDTRRERRQVLRQLLEVSLLPCQIAEADGRSSAVEAVGRCRPDAVVLELQLPLAEGLDTITELRLMTPPPRIVVCSFLRDAASVQAAHDRGADVYLTKPTSATELRAALGPLTEPDGPGGSSGPVREDAWVVA